MGKFQQKYAVDSFEETVGLPERDLFIAVLARATLDAFGRSTRRALNKYQKLDADDAINFLNETFLLSGINVIGDIWNPPSWSISVEFYLNIALFVAFLSSYKKIKRNKKYFFSIKDIILLETLASDGIEIPKDLSVQSLSKNLTVPSTMSALVENGEIGLFMLKLVEIIGSDEIKNLDPETLYFINNLLNKGKIKKVRNQILNLTLPLRV